MAMSYRSNCGLKKKNVSIGPDEEYLGSRPVY